MLDVWGVTENRKKEKKIVAQPRTFSPSEQVTT
jgi:hypothetical protein